jgi:tRNA acetyltransferase TAN1
MLYQFEKELNEVNCNYFLKESESPFIYFLEYAKPEELIKQLKINNEYSIIPVTCVISNMNYITSVILRKIRHKLCYKDTFKINCYLNKYCTSQTEENIEEELTKRIENIIKIDKSKNNPVWTINLYIVGDITAINIINTKNNRITKMWN